MMFVASDKLNSAVPHSAIFDAKTLSPGWTWLKLNTARYPHTDSNRRSASISGIGDEGEVRTGRGDKHDYGHDDDVEAITPDDVTPVDLPRT